MTLNRGSQFSDAPKHRFTRTDGGRAHFAAMCIDTAQMHLALP
jgi:hypothetical protein